eukprot:5641768-Prymnesium_polylepis.1
MNSLYSKFANYRPMSSCLSMSAAAGILTATSPSAGTAVVGVTSLAAVAADEATLGTRLPASDTA